MEYTLGRMYNPCEATGATTEGTSTPFPDAPVSSTLHIPSQPTEQDHEVIQFPPEGAHPDRALADGAIRAEIQELRQREVALLGHIAVLEQMNADLSQENKSLTREREQADAEREQSRAEVERQAYLADHDDLTKLASRRAWTENVHARLERGDVIAILRTDIDNFKIVNDTLGHHKGDELLRAFGLRLRVLYSRATDGLAGRYGGDEFDICVDIGNPLPGEHTPERRITMTPEERAAVAYERLKTMCEEFVAEMRAQDPQYAAAGLGFSIGMVTSTAYSKLGPDKMLDKMLEQVDKKLYRAKKLKPKPADIPLRKIIGQRVLDNLVRLKYLAPFGDMR